MRIFILWAVAVLMSGCANLEGFGERVLIEGAKANDSAVEAAEAVLCRGASIGAIQRRYGQDKAKADAWRTLCINKNNANIIKQ